MFLIFVVGAALFYIVMELHLLLVDSTSRQRLARSYIHKGARLLFWILQTLRLARIRINLAGYSVAEGGVVIANHPSMLDAILLLSALPNAVCIMKRSLLRLPIIGGFARRAHYIPQAEAPELLNTAKRVLATGANVIIFPEGTRSTVGRMGSFKRGAARLALEAGVPLIPFTIVMDPVVLGPQWPFERPPGTSIRYEAISLPLSEGELTTLRDGAERDIREKSARITRYLEERIRNSLL
jgi:1-acyl-sn-glycerol-3-phosphate acyltransferase